MKAEFAVDFNPNCLSPKLKNAPCEVWNAVLGKRAAAGNELFLPTFSELLSLSSPTGPEARKGSAVPLWAFYPPTSFLSCSPETDECFLKNILNYA